MRGKFSGLQLGANGALGLNASSMVIKSRCRARRISCRPQLKPYLSLSQHMLGRPCLPLQLSRKGLCATICRLPDKVPHALGQALSST